MRSGEKRSMSGKLSQREKAMSLELDLEEAMDRPKTRGECRKGDRPCPWLGCRYHLGLDLANNGKIILNFNTIDPLRMPATCSLDIAETGPHTLEQLGCLFTFTRERARQIEERALQKVEKKLSRMGFNVGCITGEVVSMFASQL